MKTAYDQSLEITKQIVEDVIKYDGDLYQLKVQMHPIIANTMYQRDKDVLMEERFRTIIALSKVLDDTNIKIAIDALGYEINLKK